MKSLVLAVLAVCLGASLADAQNILGEISTDGGLSYSALSGSPFDTGDPITVNLGSVSGDVLLRFRDSHATSVTANLGAVTIGGTLGSSSGRVSIIVAKGFDAFPNTQFLLLNPSVVNVAGITISDADLRGNTRVAIAATGNLTGGIEVGHVLRLQFTGSVGEIQAAVTATAENGSFITDTGLEDEQTHQPIYAEPLAYVRASKKISGALTATAGDIGIVSIGVTEAQTDGLQANVKALAGQIKSIYCAGAIGNPNASPAVIPEIWARERIDQIVAWETEAFEPVVLSKHFHASVKSGVGRTFVDDPPDPYADGSISLIRTNGDFEGDIVVRNIIDGGSVANGHAGVLIGGEMRGAIHVEYVVHGADIVASTFHEEIVIGVQLKGSVVATDPANGTIPSIQVGRNFCERAMEYDGIDSLFTIDAYARGFLGTDLAPKDDAIAMEDPALWLEANHGACGDYHGFQLGSMDSVIRAARIDFIDIRTMSLNATPSEFKKGRPRIEAPSIGSCVVDHLQAGVIWSGQIEFDALCCGASFDCIDNDPLNDFASVEHIEIGCLGMHSAIWYQDCAHATFLTSVHGAIHVPAIQAGEVLWIGDSLAENIEDPNEPNALQCKPPTGDGYSTFNIFGSQTLLSSDDSPRRIHDETTGRVVVHQLEGLKGQIIINGNNNGGTWDGSVIVGEDVESERIHLAPGFEQPERAPHYELPSGPLGGGAVGLAPFAFYRTDCTPEHEVGDPLMYTEFEDGTIAVVARWYGPVELPVGEEFEEFSSLAALLNLHCKAPGSSCDWYLLDAMFNFVKHPGGQKRAIGIKAHGDAIPKDGLYRLSYESQSAARLVSDDVAESPFVGVFPTGCDLRGYLFSVDADCNGNLIPDSADIVAGGFDGEGIPLLDENENGILDECEGTPPTCAADWDDNGIIGVPDIFAFLAAWFAGCDGTFGCGTPNTGPCYCKSADFNTDSIVNVNDIFAFLANWFALGPNAEC